LGELQTLLLGYTDVTDEGMAHLTGLNKLQRLSLYGTKVTRAREARLKEELPALKRFV
jgi:hypothetical protein